MKNLHMLKHTAAATVAGAMMLGTTALGDCEPGWHDLTFGSGQSGTSGIVWDQTEWNGHLIAGGAFTTTGFQTVNHIARWDGSAWFTLASGGQIGVSGTPHGTVTALTVWNGDLIAGGEFDTAGGQTVNRIARWDGSAWHSFTSGGQIGMSGSMRALTVWNGDLIAGGHFTTAGGQTVNRIARWDGSAWHPFESDGEIGMSGFVTALTVWNGDLIAGGGFTTAGGQTVNHIARWDGSAWHPFTSGGQIGVNGSVYALTVWNGDLVAGGFPTTAGGQTVNRIARWDGSAWHPFESDGEIGANSVVRALRVWNGDLIAGGLFTTAGGQTVNRIARWTGPLWGWQPIYFGGEIGVNNAVRALTGWNQNLVAGGEFTTAGDQTVNHIARLEGCLTALGACCLSSGDCLMLTESSCLAIGGTYHGDGVDCSKASCVQPCVGDLNGDGVVNVTDLLELLGAWGVCP